MGKSSNLQLRGLAAGFLAVNGFDEAYEGWGFEDSDLAIRLINLGMQRKLGLFATTVFHLYHREMIDI